MSVSSRKIFNHDNLDQVAGMLSAVPDPDTVLQKLGRTRADLRAMEGDDEVAQCLDTRRDAVVSMPWRLEPGEGAVTDWLWSELDAHWESIISAAWSSVPYGYSIMRPVYRPADDGRRIGGLAWVDDMPIELFSATGTGEWKIQQKDGTQRLIEPWELETIYLITVRRGRSRNPYGDALLSRAYWPWYFRHNAWRFWMQFLERFGSPLLIGETTRDPDTMAEALAMAVQDAVIAVGAGDKVTVAHSAGSGDSFSNAEGALVRRIQRLILGQTLTSDVGSAGSFAAAKVHDGVREDKRNADARLVTRTVQRLCNSLVRLAFSPTTEVPKFALEDGVGIQPERADRDAKLVTCGAVKLTREYFARAYDFEADDFEIPGDAPAPGPAEEAAPVEEEDQPAAGKLTRRRFSVDQEEVEALSAAAIREARQPITAEALREAIRLAKNPDDLVKRLEKLYSGPADEFQDLVQRALFTADVMGYVHAETGIGGG